MGSGALKIKDNQGFTLIELSIVLVIIDLLVGGVLVGRDLIKSAEIHAQISQIEEYNTAVLTFKDKKAEGLFNLVLLNQELNLKPTFPRGNLYFLTVINMPSQQGTGQFIL